MFIYPLTHKCKAVCKNYKSFVMARRAMNQVPDGYVITFLSDVSSVANFPRLIAACTRITFKYILLWKTNLIIKSF